MYILLLLSALWIGPARAVVSWDGPGCVYRNQTLIACYPRDASYVLELSSGGDAAYAPAAGDVYRIVRRDGGKEETRLLCRVYVGVVAR